MDLLLINNESRHAFCFAHIDTVDDGIDLWTKIAGHPGVDLAGFHIVDGDRVVYEGDYVTDEC